MKKMITGTCAAVLLSMSAYTGIAVVASATGMQDAHARRMSSSRPSSSPNVFRSSPKPATPTPTPSVAPKPATPAPSMIGSKVSTPAPSVAPKPAMATARPAIRRSAIPPVNRSFSSTPAQRSSAGSMVQPFLMGMGGAIAGTMLVNWLTAPSAQAATAPTEKAVAPADTAATGGLNIVKPQADFKVFEGANIPAEFQEKMKANNVTVEPKQGTVTEYSKTIKVKGGIDVKIDVAELPVLVVYVNEAGKPAHDLYMPI